MNDNELFELCREVYEKTGWWPGGQSKTFRSFDGKMKERVENIPLYTSDYLLEKLPKYLDDKALWLTLQSANSYEWYASYDNPNGGSTRSSYSDSPLKALLKLTLVLHKSGELK